MKGLFTGLGVVYLFGLLSFGTFDLMIREGWDFPHALGYGITWPLQILGAAG